MSGPTFYAARIPVGTRVEWRREVYRVRYVNRPIDTGVVVENDGSGIVKVRRDGTDSVVTGAAIAFSPVNGLGMGGE